MSDVVGLSLREDRIDAAVVRRRLSGTQVLATFSLSLDEAVGAALRAKLGDLGVRTRRIYVGLPRKVAVVKAIELPGVAGADLRRMVGFELERHLPFPPSDALFDFAVLDERPGQPVRVMLVAVERRVFERVRQLLDDRGSGPRLLDVTIHSLALLAAQSDRGDPLAARVVVHLEETDAELAVVRHGRPLLSRSFSLPSDGIERSQTLGEELKRSLGTLGADDRDSVSSVTVTGSGALPGTQWTDLPVRTATSLPVEAAAGDVDPAFLPALALALRQPFRGPYRTNLMPDELRPKPFPWPAAVTAMLAAATLLLAAAIPGVTAIRDERRLAALDREIAGLAAQVREAEQVASTVERARREAETLRGFEAQRLPALALVRELTELLTADVWLTNLSTDRNGVELTGFAAAAAPLIPLLEASPTLDRVEFTSPVTKGRDREQFRIKAGWEQGVGRPTAPQAGGAPSRPTGPTSPGRR